MIIVISIACMLVLHGFYVRYQLEKMRSKIYLDVIDYLIIQSRKHTPRESNPGIKKRDSKKSCLRLVQNNEEA
jgi:hypothetical protein